MAGVLSHGYIVVRIDGDLFGAHRVIWKFVTGKDPAKMIDHRDLNRANNAWTNLREADNAQNMRNSGLSRANKSGVKGVFWDNVTQSWRVRIKLNQVSHDFGRYKDFSVAVAESIVARERLHGAFARAA